MTKTKGIPAGIPPRPGQEKEEPELADEDDIPSDDEAPEGKDSVPGAGGERK